MDRDLMIKIIEELEKEVLQYRNRIEELKDRKLINEMVITRLTNKIKEDKI